MRPNQSKINKQLPKVNSLSKTKKYLNKIIHRRKMIGVFVWEREIKEKKTNLCKKNLIEKTICNKKVIIKYKRSLIRLTMKQVKINWKLLKTMIKRSTISINVLDAFLKT